MAAPATFRLTPTTRLILQRGDITRFVGDALVNAANERMLGGGGVDGAIHRAAGAELREACLAVPPVASRVRCPTGEARITPGNFGSLQVKHVVHTVGPVYREPEEEFEGEPTSAELLAGAYRSSLDLANEHSLKSVAFPAISCGVYGYPLRAAAQVAVQTCKEAAGSVEAVHFFLFGQPELDAWLAAAQELAEAEEQAEAQPEEEKEDAEAPVAEAGGDAGDEPPAKKAKEGESAGDEPGQEEVGKEETAQEEPAQKEEL